MLGGLGVILPTYLNVWQSLETAELLQDQVQRSKIENTFKLIEKWNDKALLEARNFTREQQHSTLSPDQLKAKINQTPELKQSVILVLNYFDTVRVSIEHDRVVASVIENALGGVYFMTYLIDFDLGYVSRGKTFNKNSKVFQSCYPCLSERRARVRANSFAEVSAVE